MLNKAINADIFSVVRSCDISILLITKYLTVDIWIFSVSFEFINATVNDLEWVKVVPWSVSSISWTNAVEKIQIFRFVFRHFFQLSWKREDEQFSPECWK